MGLVKFEYCIFDPYSSNKADDTNMQFCLTSMKTIYCSKLKPKPMFKDQLPNYKQSLKMFFLIAWRGHKGFTEIQDKMSRSAGPWYIIYSCMHAQAFGSQGNHNLVYIKQFLIYKKIKFYYYYENIYIIISHIYNKSRASVFMYLREAMV